MIADAGDLPAEHPFDCDVCIIGAGAAGITLALELADSDSSRRICLLESGGFKHEAAAQVLLTADGPSSRYPELHETRLAALGGSTGLWAGWCRPLDPIDFEVREWVPDSGWPFGFAELAPFYATAHRLCGLGPFDYDAHAWEGRTGLRTLSLQPRDFSPTLFHISSVHFGTHYRPRLATSGSIQTLLHATVLRLFAADGSGRIERARVATRAGKQFDVRARFFVLASGGIENPRLMLLSGDSPERSIGNERGLVGRFFMEHGFIDAGSFLAERPDLRMDFQFPTTVVHAGQRCTVRCGFSPSAERLRADRLLNSAVFFHPAYEAHDVFDSAEVKAMLECWEKMRGRAVPGGIASRIIRAMRRPDRLAVAVGRRLLARSRSQRRWRTRALFECLPRRSNGASLSTERDALGRPSARVQWQLHSDDVRSIQRVHELFDAALQCAGLGRFRARLRPADDWQAAVEGGKHHMGTTRMHTDSARGVVDADCRVHGTANLYVAGSSVFPTGGFANPTLTIVALAARLSAHIGHRLRSYQPY